MISFSDVVKRFKFDLEMGRFELYYSKDTYMFKCSNRLEYEFLYELFVALGFYHTKLDVEDYNAVILELPNKFFSGCFTSELTIRCNEIPDYIKEYLSNGSWKRSYKTI